MAATVFKGKMEICDWHEIYRPKQDMNPEWEMIRAEVIVRDGFRCFRCGKVKSQIRYLTAHHIVPRAEGGTDELANLITLDNKCHDKIEEEGCRSLAEITRSYEIERIERADKYDVKPKDDEPTGRPGIDYSDWHVWVYGGGRKRH